MLVQGMLLLLLLLLLLQHCAAESLYESSSWHECVQLQNLSDFLTAVPS